MQNARIQPVATLREAKKNNGVKRRRIKFDLKMPEAQQVILMGDFNLWNPEINPMRKDKEGVWRTSVMLYPGRYEYRLWVDGQWYNDPNNTTKCPNCFGSDNNVMEVLS
jgi:1,4-alpha-glucan branching enzyme